MTIKTRRPAVRFNGSLLKRAHGFTGFSHSSRKHEISLYLDI